MKSIDNKTPVLVLNCKLGGLAILRSLGSLGIPVYGSDEEVKAPGLLSRYCRGKFVRRYDESRPMEYLEFLHGLGKRSGKGTILIPTSDELSMFVADQSEALGKSSFSRKTPPISSVTLPARRVCTILRGNTRCLRRSRSSRNRWRMSWRIRRAQDSRSC